METGDIRKFVREHIGHSACRFLVYVTPHLETKVLFQIGRVTSAKATEKPPYHDPDEDEESGWSLAGFSDSWFILSLSEHWIRLKLVLDEKMQASWRPNWSTTHAKVKSLISLVFEPIKVPPCKIFGQFDICITSKPTGDEYKRLSDYKDGRCAFCYAERVLSTSRQAQLRAPDPLVSYFIFKDHGQFMRVKQCIQLLHKFCGKLKFRSRGWVYPDSVYDCLL